jgi:hypothetical protein
MVVDAMGAWKGHTVASFPLAEAAVEHARAERDRDLGRRGGEVPAQLAQHVACE